MVWFGVNKNIKRKLGVELIMKYAVMSDIHGNLEALTVALDKCKEVGVEKYILLGDVVGYNSNPHECLEIQRFNPLGYRINLV